MSICTGTTVASIRADMRNRSPPYPGIDRLGVLQVGIGLGEVPKDVADRASGRGVGGRAGGRARPGVRSRSTRPAGHRLPVPRRGDAGILVNHRLRTSADGVYAAGDVAQGPDFSTGGQEVHAIQPTATVETPDDATLVAVMRAAGIPESVKPLISLNGVVVLRSQHTERTVSDGDAVHFMPNLKGGERRRVGHPAHGGHRNWHRPTRRPRSAARAASSLYPTPPRYHRGSAIRLDTSPN